MTKPINKWWAYVIGAGVAVAPIHNLWLTKLLTNSKGETLFFLPAFGYLVMIMGTGLFITNHWNTVKAIGWGDRKIYIPLIIILVAIALSGIPEESLTDKLAPLFMGLSLAGLYIVSRVLGQAIVKPLVIGACVAIIGIFAGTVINPSYRTGGLLFENNYDIVVGYVLLGIAMLVNKYQWILVGVALVAILMTGSPEGFFALACAGMIIVLRRDWGKRALFIAIPIVFIVIVTLSSGRIYSYAGDIIGNQPMIDDPSRPDEEISVLYYRWRLIEDAMADIRPLGHGYAPTEFHTNTVHNVPLIMVQQLGWGGFIAGIAWLWICIYCIVKTRYKYAWSLVLILSVWDHFIWTQLGTYWWILLGISTVPGIQSDLLFKSPEVKIE